MNFSIILVLTLVQIVACAPTAEQKRTSAIFEKIDTLPSEWRRSFKVHPKAHIPLRIALKQSNLHLADSYLHDVSHPLSPNYGRHWTSRQVAETFAPSSRTVSSVHNWLAENGIEIERVRISQSLNWLHVNVTAREAEELLDTEYFAYIHNGGKRHVACERYSIPDDLRDHIDFVTPTVHFDAKILEPRKRDPSFDAKSIGKPGSWTGPVSVGVLEEGSITGELEQCDEFITLDCLRTLYRFENLGPVNENNSFAVVEFTPQAYLQSDLDLFFAKYSPSLVGHSPIFISIDGGVDQTTDQYYNINVESDLDLQYAMALAFPQEVSLYQVGDIVGDGSYNNFLDALDADYCTCDGGDDPDFDGIYPDPAEGGYKGPEDCGGFTATKVISVSYSYNEFDLTPFYMERQCNEFLKLGLMGVTVVYSSGDSGVAGRQGHCTDPVTGDVNDGSSGLFAPGYPLTCPYITSVGATQVSPNTSVFDPEAAAAGPQDVYSGGGFSNVFTIPDYQGSALAEYFKNHLPPYTSAQYNTSQSSRGFPDVAANGVNFVVYVNGVAKLVAGTSCSTPVFSSMLSTINQARLNCGKSVIGFVNPVLYAHPEMFNDIVLGNNPGCGTTGFEAVEGWDPLTGLGTANFPKMLEVFLSLP